MCISKDIKSNKFTQTPIDYICKRKQKTVNGHLINCLEDSNPPTKEHLNEANQVRIQDFEKGDLASQYLEECW